MKIRCLSMGLAAVVLACSTSAWADSVTYHGITFPQGDISFADAVVSYEPGFGGGPVPTNPNYMDPEQALGAPDYSSPYGSVSLGNGGRITLQFIDNALTGSGDSTPDLHIFEIGPAVEGMDVEISKDGIEFFSVGSVAGSVSSVDIDFYGFGPSDLFYFVRLTDHYNRDGSTGATVGADIDAVGAISTVIPPQTPVVPTPTAAVAGFVGLAGLMIRRRRMLA